MTTDTSAATVTARVEAVVPGRPDEGIWTIELTALADGPDAALADVASKGQALTALLDEIGIGAAMRSTSGVSVREEFDHVDGTQVRRGCAWLPPDQGHFDRSLHIVASGVSSRGLNPVPPVVRITSHSPPSHHRMSWFSRAPRSSGRIARNVITHPWDSMT